MPNPRMEMKPGMAGKPPMMPEMGEESAEGPETTLSVVSYPALKGIEVGAPVKGTFEGKVKSVDGDNVTVAYDNIEVSTENRADKELSKLTGQSAAPAEDEGDEPTL